MTNGHFQHMTMEESTSIQWVKDTDKEVVICKHLSKNSFPWSLIFKVNSASQIFFEKFGEKNLLISRSLTYMSKYKCMILCDM